MILVEPWEEQYLNTLDNPDVIAWIDEDATSRFKTHTFLYDKFWIAKNLSKTSVFNLQYEVPTEYPIFVKPRVNLSGMSVNARVVNSKQDLPQNCSGLIAQEILLGDQVSTDFVVINHKIVDNFSFLSHKDSNGSFTLFSSIKFNFNNVKQKLEPLQLPDCVGNVETIGNKIIEVHLRPSLQFFDICGNLMKNGCSFFNKETMTYKKSEFENTYSKVYRLNYDAFVKFKLETIDLPENIRSIQFCWKEGLPLSANAQDLFSFRYLVINGSNLKSIEKFGNFIHQHLEFKQ